MTTDELRDMLNSADVTITLPLTFTHGRCVQVATRRNGGKVKSPVIVPNEGETAADVLRMLASLLD